MVIYIQYKFHKIPFIGYLYMAEDGQMHREKEGWKDGQCLTCIAPPLAGDNKVSKYMQQTT